MPVTMPNPSAVPTLSAPAILPSSPDGPPPKKKACLTVAGMPPPLKRQQTATDQASLVAAARKQRGQLQSAPGTLDAIFGQVSSPATALELTPTNEPCLPCPAIVGLTRSQRLFSVVTEVDRRALTFDKGASSHEFFLFMKLRATHKWATFQMSPYNWVCAASTYNTAIKDLNRKQGTELPLKTPRALLDKLSEVEAQVVKRIRDSSYTCKLLFIFTFSA